ncbi:hypothetical protein I7V28_09880 [Lelliottia amnigena]|uniref:hypothetical protein n=1 Tax=Lelliottia amnigena TaxID=61646 RepID=UPI00192BE5C1|nr:hypothetical protein [Lelliottia amnigena]MBL5921418.1 hypothetical protein [Lelliottia amnigena]
MMVTSSTSTLREEGAPQSLAVCSSDGTNHVIDTVQLVNSYNKYNSTSGVDLLFGTTASRASITSRGEPACGQATKFSISGVVPSVQSSFEKKSFPL